MTPGYRVIIRVPECGSTQTYLKNSSLPGWSVVWADRQTEGHGRKGRSWESPSGGLYYSFRYPEELPDVPPGLQVLAAARAWLGILDGRTAASVQFALKWPNDLLCNGRKLAGFLAEQRGRWVDLGVGVNVNVDFGPALSGYRRTPVSLSEAAGRRFSIPELLLDWIKKFSAALRTGSREYFTRESLQRKMATVGREVEVEGRTGKAVGLDDSGALLVDFDGEAELIYSRDVREVQRR